MLLRFHIAPQLIQEAFESDESVADGALQIEYRGLAPFEAFHGLRVRRIHVDALRSYFGGRVAEAVDAQHRVLDRRVHYEVFSVLRALRNYYCYYNCDFDSIIVNVLVSVRGYISTCALFRGWRTSLPCACFLGSAYRALGLEIASVEIIIWY